MPAAAASAATGGRVDQYTGGVTVAVIVTCLLAASGGLLFGYDVGVTGGVTSMKSWQAKFFPALLHAPNSTSPYCQYDDVQLQLFTSSLFLSGGAAALGGSWTSTHWGRRATMILSGITFLAGVVLQAAAVNLGMLIAGRVTLGVGVGLANQSVPLYLSEAAPHHLRGAINILFQLAVTIGILAAQLINFGTERIEEWGWRLSLALAGVPAIVLTVGSICLSDTPNSLLSRGKVEEARAVLQKIRGVEDVNVEFEDICLAARAAASVGNPWLTILKPRYRPQLVLAILIPIFQQLTGINSIMFYAPQLFSSLGSGAEGSLLSTLITGVVNVVSTVVALVLVDRLGRRMLFLQGGVQMLICEILVGALLGAGFAKHGDQLPPGMAKAVLALICLFVASFAWSWGPLAWLVPSEIQPLETRSAAFSITVLVNFLATFAIGQSFLSMLCNMQFGIFFFFGAWVAVMTCFVYFLVPETKNLPIEEVEQAFKSHWAWGRMGDVQLEGVITVPTPEAGRKASLSASPSPTPLPVASQTPTPREMLMP